MGEGFVSETSILEKFILWSWTRKGVSKNSSLYIVACLSVEQANRDNWLHEFQFWGLHMCQTCVHIHFQGWGSKFPQRSRSRKLILRTTSTTSTRTTRMTTTRMTSSLKRTMTMATRRRMTWTTTMRMRMRRIGRIMCIQITHGLCGSKWLLVHLPTTLEGKRDDQVGCSFEHLEQLPN